MKKKIILLLVLSTIGILSFAIWKFSSPRNSCALPIHFSSDFNVAYATVTIEGQTYSLALDLGMDSQLSLNKDVLKKIKEKQPCNSIGYYDVKGNHYVSDSYIIPEIKIGRPRIFNVTIKEENEEYLKNVRFRSPKDEKAQQEFDRTIVGRIGSEMFSIEGPRALFLDLGRSKAFVIKDIDRFHEDGYSIEKMVKIPYELNQGFVIEVETDFGKKKFLLDTGLALNNVIRDSLVDEKFPTQVVDNWKLVTSSKFQFGDKDFGSENFFPFAISPIIEGIDGILGMSFFRKYAVLLDLQKKVAYICPSQTTNNSRR